jgi:hypothetical protein
MSLTSRSVVSRAPQIAWRSIAGRTVLLKAPMSSLHTLNKVGELIWSLLEKPLAVAELREAVCGRFEVGPEEAERDILEFLAKLDAQGLITVGHE